MALPQARRLNEFYNTEEDMLVGKADLNTLLQMLRVTAEYAHTVHVTTANVALLLLNVLRTACGHGDILQSPKGSRPIVGMSSTTPLSNP